MNLLNGTVHRDVLKRQVKLQPLALVHMMSRETYELTNWGHNNLHELGKTLRCSTMMMDEWMDGMGFNATFNNKGHIVAGSLSGGEQL